MILGQGMALQSQRTWLLCIMAMLMGSELAYILTLGDQLQLLMITSLLKSTSLLGKIRSESALKAWRHGLQDRIFWNHFNAAFWSLLLHDIKLYKLTVHVCIYMMRDDSQQYCFICCAGIHCRVCSWE